MLAQIEKIFPELYATWKFITGSAECRDTFAFWARWMRLGSSSLSSWRSSLMSWRMDTLLCGDSLNNDRWYAVVRVPVARQQILSNAIVEYSNGRAVFSAWSMPTGYKRDEVWCWVQLRIEFCTGVCKERTSVGSRGITIVGAVARIHLVTGWEQYILCSSKL
jgi:hypothetical protein